MYHAGRQAPKSKTGSPADTTGTDGKSSQRVEHQCQPVGETRRLHRWAPHYLRLSGTHRGEVNFIVPEKLLQKK